MKDIDINELQTYCDAQFRQIAELRSEIVKYKEEIKHLKSLLSAPILTTSSTMTNEEYIALHELEKLKLKSDEQELTYEEAKKVELYHKILQKLEDPAQEKSKKELKKLSTDELLSKLTVISNESK